MIILVNPSTHILELVHKNKKFIAIYQNSIIYYQNYPNKYKNLGNPIDFELKNTISLRKLDSNIMNWYFHTFSRWYSDIRHFEIVKRTSFIYILSVIEIIKSYSPKYAIFFTAAPHHVFSTCVKIALNLLNSKEVYFYSNCIDGRLIPIIQNGYFETRSIVNLNLENFNSLSSIDEFYNNTLNGKKIKYNTSITFWKKSLFVAFLIIIKIKIKSLIISIQEKNKKTLKIFKNNYSIFDDLKLLFNQFLSNIFYKKNCFKFSDLNKDYLRKFVIFAHFQPESTTFPEGGNYTNHVDVIITLKSKFNYPIYYREHPASLLYWDNTTGPTRVGLCRTYDYYKNLLKLGVILTDINEKILYDAKGVIPVTISGSIAIERALCGYPTVVMGNIWFSKMPGIVRLDEIKMYLDIDNDYFNKKNIEISINAKLFLNKILSKSSITNIYGIGTGIKYNNDSDKNSFINEYNNLWNHLTNENNK